MRLIQLRNWSAASAFPEWTRWVRVAMALVLVTMVAGACSSTGRAAVRPGRTETTMVASWYGPQVPRASDRLGRRVRHE